MENVCKQKKEIFEKAAKTVRVAGIPTKLLHPRNTRQHTHIFSHILKKSEAEWIENLQCLNCPPIQTIQPRLIKFTTRRRHWPFQRHNRDH